MDLQDCPPVNFDDKVFIELESKFIVFEIDITLRDIAPLLCS